jgi:hypothetical protein
MELGNHRREIYTKENGSKTSSRVMDTSNIELAPIEDNLNIS